MQPCRFCFRIIPVAKPYDPTEDWICSECTKEVGDLARRINKEDLQKAIQSSLDAYGGQDPGGVCIKGRQEVLDQRGDEPADAGHGRREGSKTR